MWIVIHNRIACKGTLHKFGQHVHQIYLHSRVAYRGGGAHWDLPLPPEFHNNIHYTAQIIWLQTQAKRNRLLSQHYCVIYLLVYTHGSSAYTYISRPWGRPSPPEKNPVCNPASSLCCLPSKWIYKVCTKVSAIRDELVWVVQASNAYVISI